MSKRIEIDGVFYRERRGKLVAIPPQWVGRVAQPQNIRNRPSKLHGKLKRVIKDAGCSRFKDRRDALGGTDV